MKHFQMKWALALFACGALLAGCNDDENGSGANLPDKQTVEAFQKQFPDATDVRWGKKKGYDVAKFGLPTRAAAARHSAWYPEGGTSCAYTKLDISWEQLQQEAPAVARAWNASAYKAQGYRLDDIGKKTYAEAEATFKLEIELGESERDLVYKADGTLLSDRPDVDADDEEEEDEPCPQEILQFIVTELPEALIVESDSEHEDGVTRYEVEITLVKNSRETETDLIFSDRFEFLCAAEEIDEDDYENTAVLPAAVYTKFQQLAGANEMDDVAKLYFSVADFKAGTNARYAMTVEDEQTDRETTYVVDADGNLLE